MAQMRITDGKGVQFTFDNGITVSIQIGGGNYGDNYDFPIGEISRNNPLPPSACAELAVWDASGTWFDLDGDQVAGYVKVSDVLGFIAYLNALPEGTTAAFKLDHPAITRAAA